MTMLPHIVTFTSLYPNSIFPRHGIFVEERLKHIRATGQIDVTVIAPVPWFPFKSDIFGEYCRFAHVPRREERMGLLIEHPRYPVIPKIGMPISPFSMALSVAGLFEHLKSEWASRFVIDSHYLYPDAVAACLIGRWLKLPVIMTARGQDVTLLPKYPFARAMIRWAIRNCQKVITVSESLREQLIALGVDANHVVTLRNGVDSSRFQLQDKRKAKAAVGFQGITLVSVGHLIDRKEHQLIIKAMTNLPDAHLVIIGEGPLKSRLQELANRLNVHSRVSFIPNISQKQLISYYNAADATILVSRREGMPNVVLESLSCGTPVIATDVEGVPELLDAPEAGIVIDDWSPDTISAAVKRLLANYPERTAIRRHAAQFDWAPTSRGVIAILESCALGRY
jgi:glycosyltransferase involved in cell wall biosynthesis